MLITIEPDPNDPGSVRVWWRDMIGSRQYGSYTRESLTMSEGRFEDLVRMLNKNAEDTRAAVLDLEPK